MAVGRPVLGNDGQRRVSGLSNASDVFCHVRELGGLGGLVLGSRVSFVFEGEAELRKASMCRPRRPSMSLRRFVRLRQPRTETLKRFCEASGDSFVHKREYGGMDLNKSQDVSFVLRETQGRHCQARSSRGGWNFGSRRRRRRRRARARQSCFS